MLRKTFWTLTLLGAASFITGCVKYEDDSIQYAAEFFTDEFGRPQKGHPQYELTVVIKAGADSKNLAFVPPAEDKAGPDYDPPAEEALDLLGNYDKKSGRYFMLDHNDSPIAHLNPHKAYSPYTSLTGGKYTELNPGKNGAPGPNFDLKHKKFYRVVPKELPCWRCGGTNRLMTFGNEEECPECDSTGFTEYYGVRALKNHKDTGGSSKIRTAKRSRN
jgi:hypothetical protein